MAQNEFAITVNLKLNQVEQEIEKTINATLAHLARLEQGGLQGTIRGKALTEGIAGVEVGARAAAEQLRRQGAPEAAVRSLMDAITAAVERTKRIVDLPKTGGTMRYPGLRQIEDRAEDLADALDQRRIRAEARDADVLAAGGGGRRGAGGVGGVGGFFDDEEAREYRDLMVGAQQLARAQAEALNATNEYAKATADLTRAENLLAARIARQNREPENIAAAATRRVDETRTTRERDLAIEGMYNSDDAVAVAMLAVQRKQRATEEALYAEQLLQGDQQLIRNTAELNALRQRRVREEQRATLALTGSPADIRAGAELAALQRRRARREAQALEGQFTQTDANAEALLQATRARRARLEATALERQQAADASYIQETTELAMLRRQRKNREERALLQASFATIGDEADTNLLRRQRRAAQGAAEVRAFEGLGAVAQRNLIEAEAEAAAARKSQAARVRASTERMLDADAEYNQAVREAADRRRRHALEERARHLGVGVAVGDTDETIYRNTAYAEQVRNAQRRADIQERLVRDEQGLLGMKVAERNAQRRINTALNERIRAEDAMAGRRGSFYQRFQQRADERNSGVIRNVDQYNTLGTSLKQAAFTNLRYGVTGGLMYGGVAGITSMIREAEELEKVLNQVRAQFESLDEAADFEGFRDEILDIARVTGAASNEVASVAFQLKGAFDDTTVAAEATRASFELVRVTGLEITEVTDSITAIARTFGELGREQETIRELSDYSLGLQERFGVLSKETVTFVGDMAAVGKEAGLTLRDTAALGAAAQQASGRSGATLAEAFNRIIPALSDASAQIVMLYQNSEDLQAGLPSLLENLDAGATGKVLLQLVRDWDKLSLAQQDFFIQQIGGRREAQALIPILLNNTKLIAELDNNYNDAGKTTEYFNTLQETLSQSFARLGEQFRQLGEALFRAGLSDLLQDIATVAGGLIAVLRPIVSLFAELNELTQGNLARFLEVAMAIGLLTAAYRRLAAAAWAANNAQAGEKVGRIGGALSSLGGYGGGIRGAYQTGSMVGQGRMVARGASATGVISRGAGLASGAGRAGVAALGGPVTVMVASGLAVAATYASKRSEVTAEEKKLVDRIKKMDREKLEEIGEIKSTFWDRVGYQIFGVEDPETLRQRELRSSRLDTGTAGIEAQLRAYVENYGHNDDLDNMLQDVALRSGSVMGSVADLADKVAEGDAKAIKIAQDLIAEGQTDPELRRHLENSLKIYNFQKKQAAELAAKEGIEESEALRVTSGSAIENAAETQRLYDAGLRTGSDLIRTYRHSIAAYEALTNPTQEQRNQLAELRQNFQKAMDSWADEEMALLDALGDVSGEAPGNRLERLEAAYAAAATPQRRQSLALEIIKQQKTMQDARVAAAETAKEELAILREGMTISPAIRTDLAAELLRVDEAWQTLMADFTAAFGDGAAVTRQSAELAVQMKIGTNEAAVIIIRNEIDRVRNLLRVMRRAGESGRDIDELLSQLNSLTAALAEIEGRIAAGDVGVAPGDIPGKVGPTPEEIKAAEERLRREEEENRKKAEDEAQARIDLEKARAEAAGDIVRVAELEIESAIQAGRAAAAAGDKAGEIRAAAARIAAESRMGEVMRDIFEAQEELAITMLEISGQTVEAAEARAAQARRRFEEMRAAQPRNAPLLAQLEGEAASLAAEAETAARTDRIGDLDWLYEQDQITAQAFIASLQAELAAIPLTNKEARREIERRINSLREEMSADLQFNFADINLQGLYYQANRLNQAEAVGRGYQDHRTINASFEINNGMDQETARQWLIDAIGGGARTLTSRGGAY